MTDDVATHTTRLGQADAGELLTLQLAAWVREGRAAGTLEIPPLQEGLADVETSLGDPAITTWGYRAPAGRLLATVRTSLLDERTAFVGRLGVVPDLVRKGIGGAMLRLAESRLPAVSRIELVTGIHSLDNHAFYARHGYVIVSTDEAEGTVRLAKDLRVSCDRHNVRLSRD
ncbi:Histone acetyltransferase HPA2 and related acetyltransferases [Alloactinosynnema sp. L-07]|uniref:GNAT family N-acetyltransferase n=1 Tax=Alloactinosynnema sp. L-07 TaxID=1653480 RepID=UPI00065EFFB3|nr:GNAT family N-acetyltransferase [Alloactinosynnema sp. L-07]CRK60017.1 Histone acetyltransferase HPA2 and related acetyltransferases [Alloactinosynnema sp. L-07]